MGKVVDLDAGRSRRRHRQDESRTEDLKGALRAAREIQPSSDEATRKLLDIFKRKPPARHKPSPQR